MVDNIPSITQFAQEVKNEEDAIAFLVQHGVIKPIEEEYCIEEDCGGKMGIKNKKSSLRQLEFNHCHSCQSRFANTFFDGAKIEIHIILYLSIMSRQVRSKAGFDIQQENLERNCLRLLQQFLSTGCKHD
jgi:hypothetical protein